MESIKVVSPSSVANVSCGFDVLGFCLDGVGDEMIIRKSKRKGIQITNINGHQLTTNPEKNERELLSFIDHNVGEFIQVLVKASGISLKRSFISSMDLKY